MCLLLCYLNPKQVMKYGAKKYHCLLKNESWNNFFYMFTRGLHEPDFSGPARTSAISARPGPARPEIEIESSVRARPSHFFFFFFDFDQDRLFLSDFKTGQFSCLHIINVLFADDLLFCNSLKQQI